MAAGSLSSRSSPQRARTPRPSTRAGVSSRSTPPTSATRSPRVAARLRRADHPDPECQRPGRRSLFRGMWCRGNLPPGPPPGRDQSDPLTVLTKAPAPPDTDVYDDQIGDIPQRRIRLHDHARRRRTLLHRPQALGLPPSSKRSVRAPRSPRPAHEARFPPRPPSFSPTLIEYSGYATARPSGPESGIAALANLMGYTVVDVSMRGTGCSGGAFDSSSPSRASTATT